MPGRPDASVVVIAYNDAERLPRAVGSVLNQSLGDVEVVIVDDASTDATGRLADGLAAAYAGRVRSIHLPENSGGCGGPRNAGIEHARGAHVMFLDSDDVLDRHACLNLVSTAEETAADLVSGLCSRVYLDRRTRRESRWYPELYDRRAVYDSVRENPDLLYDTLATNKCYRRDFLADHGLRFAEKLHYEDLLFTAQAYLAARRVALIPHRVYTWYVQEKAPSPSISNRRAELANFADRLEVHRRIDALFRTRGTRELELAKGAKFINHDLILYLRELRARDTDYRERFLELASSYVAELDPQVFEEARKIPAIAAFMVREHDYAGALAAADYSRTDPPELRAELVERAGRVYWGRRHLDGEPRPRRHRSRHPPAAARRAAPRQHADHGGASRPAGPAGRSGGEPARPHSPRRRAQRRARVLRPAAPPPRLPDPRGGEPCRGPPVLAGAVRSAQPASPVRIRRSGLGHPAVTDRGRGEGGDPAGP
jgi:CDP-glycerol glycerophosphotransferase